MIRKSSFFAIALSFAFASSADQAPVTYVDSNGVSQVCNSYTVVDENTTVWSNSWYLVAGEVSIDGGVLVSNDVHVILADGSVLEVDAANSAMAGIGVEDNFSLSVYGQTIGNGTLYARGAEFCAGIGSHYSSEAGGWACGTIVINGGKITAVGGDSAAGIGGCVEYGGGVVKVNGGEVVATGGRLAAGIGGGNSGSGGNVTINGGLVVANGGVETATGCVGSGIGAGVKFNEDWEMVSVDNGTLAIGPNLVIDPSFVVRALESSSQSYVELETDADGEVHLGQGNDYSKLLVGTTLFEDGYYLVGVFGGVDLRDNIDESRRFRKNPNADDQYRIIWTLSEGDSFEVVEIADYRIVARYGTNNVAGSAYVVSAAEAGIRVLNFGPQGVAGTPGGCLSTSELPVVTYLDVDGSTKPCSNYQFVSADMRNWTTGWYVVDSSVDIPDGGIVVSGDVNLVLMDGTSLSVKGSTFDAEDVTTGDDVTTGEAGILVETGNSLVIFGQALGTGTLTAKGGGTVRVSAVAIPISTIPSPVVILK